MHRSSFRVGERGFEPPTSASRTLRANRAALLPEQPREHNTPSEPLQSWRPAAAPVLRSSQGNLVPHARVAQRIERHRPKVGVGGSSPSAGTGFAKIHLANSLPRSGQCCLGEKHSPSRKGAGKWTFRFAVMASQ